MTSNENRATVLTASIIGVCLVVGVSIGGYFIGKGGIRFKFDIRTVTGVLLDGQREYGTANPRYIVTTFNALRPQLLAEATKNARLTAQQFASDSGAKVGRIRSANQGMIQIFGSDGMDESAPYSQTSTPVKKIRVVSTFEFELR